MRTRPKSVENFITFLFESAVNKSVKDALKGESPRTGGASGSTKEQIMKVKWTGQRQKIDSGEYAPIQIMEV